MKIELRDLFEHRGIEYEYSAVIYEGDDAYRYPDKITDLDRADQTPIADDIWEQMEAAALEHAYETLRKSRGLKGNEALFYNSTKGSDNDWTVNVDERHADAFCELIKACGNVILSVKPLQVNGTVNIAYSPLNNAEK